MTDLHDKEKGEWETIRLVKVDIYAPGSDYGLSDAVSPWSDCNRSAEHLFRVDDIDRDNKHETIEIRVRKKDLKALVINLQEK